MRPAAVQFAAIQVTDLTPCPATSQAAAAAYLWIRVSKMDLQMYGEGRVRGARQVPMVDFAVIGRGGRGRGGGDSERGGSERDDVGLLTDSAV
jgi:hypothetical protein